jgi:hypothetical protein
MVLEFGQWVYENGYDGQQQMIFRKTWPALIGNLDTIKGGYVGAAVWWSLEDYWTDVSGIGVERFGLFAPDGSIRAVGTIAKESFGEVTVPTSTVPAFTPGGAGAAAPVPEPTHIFMHLGFALLFPIALVVLLVAVMVMLRRRRRPLGATA